jgi:hypothetical protein
MELPDMIRYAAGGKVYFNAQGNFVVVRACRAKMHLMLPISM